ncbi:MAG TPA: NADH-quinone oxidoreductase subunit J [Bacteroidia bacterium]|jgi:NADH-quinone oxidoreductase subunit J|nr:NADH-quinone oxidoreductase subunit J [Bacteroidia bacterium]
MITKYIFYFLSVLIIFSSLMVVFSKNPVHSVLYLIVTFFGIAGHYFLLNAQFLAAVHIIVYAGAIMVLFLYVIMMLNLNKETEPHKPVWVKFAAVVAGGLLMITLIGSLRGAETLMKVNPANANIGLVENLGQALFGPFLLPFEISSVLFLAAMVGAVMLGKKEIH